MAHLAIVACCLAVAVAAAPTRPNIIWIMSDDLGVGEVGLYPANSPNGRIDTPHLDQFGKEGIIFKQAYAGYTVCAPSRTTFFTGRHSGQFVKLGLDGTIVTPEQRIPNIAQMLQSAGYQTGVFGKCAPLSAPLEQGFEVFLGQIDQKDCHNMYPREIDSREGKLNFPLEGNNHDKSRELCMKHPEKYNYTIDVFHDNAMEWLHKVAKVGKPFFLYLGYTIPHAGGWADHPLFPEEGNPVPTDLQYVNKTWPDVEKDHAAVITYMDIKVGDLMKRVKELGVDDNTLIFFASDNGAHLEGGHSLAFFDSTGGLPGHKRSMFEGGVRSPTMARWPAVIKAGQESNFPWAFWDVFPTLAELVGVKVPEGLDGISFAATLRGESQGKSNFQYFTWSDDGGQTPPGYTVRYGKWKWMVPHCADVEQLQPSFEDEGPLFDLLTDPFETTDVEDAHPEVIAFMKALVVAGNFTCRCFQCAPLEDPELLVV